MVSPAEISMTRKAAFTVPSIAYFSSLCNGGDFDAFNSRLIDGWGNRPDKKAVLWTMSAAEPLNAVLIFDSRYSTQ